MKLLRSHIRSLSTRTLIRALVAAGCALIGGLVASNSPANGNPEIVTIAHITDGDTISVIYKGTREHVRLIGIDTPESNNNKKAHRDSQRSGKDLQLILKQGEEAAEHMRLLLKNNPELKIAFDVEARDRYGRMLAYLYLPDGEMLNLRIIEDGYAYPLTIPPNVKHAREFKAAFAKARENKRGLWAR